MRALSYLLKTTIINYFKRLKQKPQKAIGPIFVILWFGIMFLPKGNSKGFKGMSFEVFVTILLAILFLMFLYTLYSGTKKLDSHFTMSDVNLIFVSPIKPQTVLLYGVIKKIALELLTSIYILYQIPNVLGNFNVPVVNQIVLILAVIIFQLIFSNILKLFIFALNTKYKNLGQIIRSAVKAVLVLMAAGAAFIIVKGDIKAILEKILNVVVYSSWIGNIPVIGWIREIIVQVIKGLNISTFLYLSLFLLLSALMLYITYILKLDYYEDMLSSAEMYSTAKNIKTSKETAVSGSNNAFFTPIRKRGLKLDNIHGAKVLFFKHINEYAKRSFVFFVNTYSLILLTASLVLGIFAKGLDIKIIFLASCGLLFFSAGMASKIYNEIYHHFIFLLPDTPQRKLFYGMVSSLVKAVTDSVLLFLPFAILSEAPIFEVLLCMLCYLLLAGMLSYSGLFAFRIAQFFGFDGMIAQGLLFTFFQLFLAVPLIAITAVTTIGFKSMNGYTVYLSSIIYSIVMAVLFSYGNVGIFKNTEF